MRGVGRGRGEGGGGGGGRGGGEGGEGEQPHSEQRIHAYTIVTPPTRTMQSTTFIQSVQTESHFWLVNCASSHHRGTDIQ